MNDHILQIYADWDGCIDCNLHKNRERQIWERQIGEPCMHMPFIIGTAPSYDDQSNDQVFSNPASKILDRMLSDLGLTNVYMTNMVLCHPPDRPPNRTELKACFGRLKRFLNVMQPRVIITAGRLPGQMLLNNFKLKMTEMVGQVYRLKIGEINPYVIPIYHPSHLHRKKSRQLDNETIDRLKIVEKIWSNK